MNECLITKLKSSVNNDDLSYLGKISFKMRVTNPTGVVYFCTMPSMGGNVAVRFTGGLRTIFDDKTFVGTSENVFDYQVGAKNLQGVYEGLCIISKYNLAHFTQISSNFINCVEVLSSVDLKEFSFCKDLNYFDNSQGFKFKGDLSDMPKNNYSFFRINNSNDNNDITGSIEILKNSTNLTSLDLYLNTNIYGDIANLGNCVKINHIATNKTGITGDFKTFVELQRAAGRESCDSIALYISDKHTFGGMKIPFKTSNYITWTESSITLFLGGSTEDAATHVYAIGASESKISEWRSAGKTVVVVE